MSRKLFLLDGSALVYRAFFALQRMGLTNRKGDPTGAVFGFANTLHALVKQERPDYLAVVFDPPGPTFRHKMYAPYKANRAKTPDELRAQLPRVRELVRAWPCVAVETPGYEADDLIGSYATQLAGPDLEVVAVTGDKDFYQLLSPHVRILNPGRGGVAAMDPKLIGPDDLPEKFGVTDPRQVVDVLALMGDSSDNVPGVPGIGPKTASNLIAEYGSLEGVYAHLEDLKAGVRGKLEAHREGAFQSRDLVTIRTDLELPVDLEAMRTVPPGGDALISILKDLDFQRMLADLGPSPVAMQESLPLLGPRATYRHVVDPKTLGELAARWSTVTRLGLSVEPADEDPHRADLLGIALADGTDSVYIPLAHAGGENAPHDVVRELLQPVLNRPDLQIAIHDAKAGHQIMARAGWHLEATQFDVGIAAYLLDPDARHTLAAIAQRELDLSLQPRTDLLGKGAKATPGAQADPSAFAAYVAEAADATYQLQGRLREQLDRAELSRLFDTLEMPLVEVLRIMEDNGMALDLPFLRAMSTRLEREMEQLEQRAHALADQPFNVNSPSQLAEILFDQLGLPKGRKTKTGYSTDSEVLEGLRALHELPGVVLDYRQLTKLKSTYVDALPALVDPKTGRVHGRFNQTVAATGRLSSSDPNLQNIPIRTELGREVRRAFVPGEPGWVLVSADYSQIELRIMAHLSKDPALVHAFQAGLDVHRDTASRIFGVRPEEVTDLQRGQAKTVNFAVLYGQGPYGLARTLGITNKEASAFITGYKEQYAGVVAYLDGTLEAAARRGFVTTLAGRRRYLPGLKLRAGAAKAAAERLAVNTPIQGSAADLIKQAMISLHRRMRETSVRARLLLQVHDELVLECPSEEASAIEAMVREAMVSAMTLDVPIVVNVGVGADWAGIH